MPPGSTAITERVNDQLLHVTIRRGDDPSIVASRCWDRPFLIVGRRTDCDLCLDDPTVSARHLYLQKLPGRVVAFDLGSRDFGKRSGVLGRPGFQLADRLLPGDNVQVGDFWLSITVENPPVEPTDSISIESISHLLPKLAYPVAVWNVTIDDGEHSSDNFNRHGETRTIQHEVTLIGRGPQCRLQLPHESVSTTHASLVFAQGELHVIDLCSRYGVKVNGRLVKSVRLMDGDELTIGECQGVLRLLTASPPPQKAEAQELPPVSSESRDAQAIIDEVKNDATFDGLVVRLCQDSMGELAAPVPSAPQVPAMRDVVLDLQTLLMQSSQREVLVREQARQLVESVDVRLKSVPENAATSVAGEVEPHQNDNTKSYTGKRVEAGNIPDLHSWLNSQLAGLNSESPGRWRQFWKTLTGRF